MQTEARLLAALVDRVTTRLVRGEYRELADQMRRAAGSIHANIAEGGGRRTPRDRLHYFDTAWASLRELEAHAAHAGDLGLLPAEAPVALAARFRTTGRLLWGLRRATERALARP